MEKPKSRNRSREKGREYNATYRNNPLNKQTIIDNRKKYYVRRTFNLSVKEYDAYFEDASCGICTITTGLVLDHCHTTGNVRGVLCKACNRGIGMLQDDIKLLEKAVVWLSS